MLAQSKKKSVVVYGGAFNPLTNSHAGVIHALSTKYDICLLNPCIDPPHKSAADLAPLEIRIQMIRDTFPKNGIPILSSLSLATVEHSSICILPFDSVFGGRTYPMLRALKDVNQDCEISLAIGSDQLEVLHTWSMWEQLIAEFHLVLIPRDKHQSEISYPWTNSAIKPDFMDPVPGLSSSEIRASIKQAGNLNRGLCGISVATSKIIKDNCLYGYLGNQQDAHS